MSLARSLTPLALSFLALAGCSNSGTSGGSMPSPRTALSITPPSPDPRVGLKAGRDDAGEAAWNMRLV